MNQPERFKNLKLPEEEVDGVAFHIDEENTNEDQTAWNFTIMKLNGEENKNDFQEYPLGFKYQILLYKGNEAEFFEAIVGDVKHYINNMVKANQEGLMIKKCKKSEEIMNKIFHGRMVEALQSRIFQIRKAGAV